MVNVHSDKMSEEEPHRPTDGPCENHGIVPANVNQQQDNDSESTSDYEPVCEVSPEILDFDEHGVCTEAALFVSKLRSCSSMTMSSTSFVIESVSSMVKNIVGNLKASTIESFKRYADSPEEPSVILEKLEENFDSLSEPFQGLNSEYLEKKYFLATGTLVQPEEILLGHRFESRMHAETGISHQVQIKDTCYYIPLKAMMRNFLQAPGVWQAMQSYKSYCGGFLKAYFILLWHENNSVFVYVFFIRITRTD